MGRTYGPPPALKDTALGFLIGYPELLFTARTLGGQAQFDFPIIPVAIVLGAIYIAKCLLLSAWRTTWNAATRAVDKRARQPSR